MVEGGGGTPFPVLFYDGEREMDIGDVEIHPDLEYKPFQQMLSQKIGISPNQISIYLVNRRRSHKSAFTEERRRVPITGKVNFASVCRQKGCSFLAVLKRSRKSRNRRERMISGDFLPENEFSSATVSPVTDNMMLLRRSQPMPFYDHITQSELDDLNCRLQLRDFMVQKENHQMTMAEEHLKSLNLGWEHGLDSNSYLNPFPTIEDIYRPNSACSNTWRDQTKGPAFCEECWNAKQSGGTAAFHPCVNDAVVTRSTTRRLGPINRPSKSLP